VVKQSQDDLAREFNRKVLLYGGLVLLGALAMVVAWTFTR
jgi:hypothetical protein